MKEKRDMFVANIGEDGLTHRVASALFEKGKANGEGFCGSRGEVRFSTTDVITCEKCRSTLLRSIRNDLSIPGKKET